MCNENKEKLYSIASPYNEGFMANRIDPETGLLTEEISSYPNVRVNKDSVVTPSDPVTTVLDRDWSKKAFLIPDTDLVAERDKINRLFSSADIKFLDTRLGCNIGINPRPQFTRYADIRRQGRLAGRQKTTLTNTVGNVGMGRYYSEAIDDPAQIVYVRFGVPQFNSLTNFITNAFDTSTITLMNTGRATSIWRKVGDAIGTIARWVNFPAVSLAIFTGKTLYKLFSSNTYKFYTLKPTMHLYWSIVNTLVNGLAVNLGIFPKILQENNINDKANKIGSPYVMDQDLLNELRRLYPDLLNDQNAIDMYKVANKGVRLANHVFIKEYEMLNRNNVDLLGYLKKEYETATNNLKPMDMANKQGSPSLASFLAKFVMVGDYITDEKAAQSMEKNPRAQTGVTDNTDTLKTDGSPVIVSTSQTGQQVTEKNEDFLNYMDAEFRDGSQFAIFRVDHTRSMNESFSNSVTESDISQKINSISSQFKDIRFSVMDGNISDTVSKLTGAVTDFVGGMLSGVSAGLTDTIESLVKGLGGSAYVDIPKHWQSSNANLPRANYTMQLVSPYGNPISRLINIYIPLCMLMAGMLPRATGKASYTSPFICQVFDRGKVQTRLGIMDSLSINRGVTNLPHDIRGGSLSIDVSWSVIDLSSIMAMPIGDGGILDWLNISEAYIDEDNILMDYLAVLAAQDLYSQFYPLPKARLYLAKKIMNVQKLVSPAYWASAIHDTSVNGFLRYTGVGPLIEALAGGNPLIENRY